MGSIDETMRRLQEDRKRHFTHSARVQLGIDHLKTSIQCATNLEMMQTIMHETNSQHSVSPADFDAMHHGLGEEVLEGLLAAATMHGIDTPIDFVSGVSSPNRTLRKPGDYATDNE